MTKSFFGIPCVDYNVLKFYKKPKLSGENIKELLNESNLMSVLVFYDTFEHASQDYDRYVLSLLCEPCLNKKEIESFRKMLINDISDIELAKLWYSALDESQKNYLKLLGFKYND
jgi:isochorismate hydrolase